MSSESSLVLEPAGTSFEKVAKCFRLGGGVGFEVNEVLMEVLGDVDSESFLLAIRVPEGEAEEATSGGGDDFGSGGADVGTSGAFLLLDFSGCDDVMALSPVVLSSNTLDRAFSGPAFCLLAYKQIRIVLLKTFYNKDPFELPYLH